MLKVDSKNALTLGFPWKQGYLLNYIMSLELEIITISETRLHNPLALKSMFAIEFNTYFLPVLKDVWSRHNSTFSQKFELRSKDKITLDEHERQSMCEAFQQIFALLYATIGGSERRVNLNIYLHNLSRPSAKEAACTERSITAADVLSVMPGCTGEKLPGFDSLPYEAYCHIPTYLKAS